MMKALSIRTLVVCVLSIGFVADLSVAQVVSIAPVVKQTPTAGGGERISGATPPASDSRVDAGTPFYIELWATNIGAPLDGMACVHVDLFYDRTDLIDIVPPVEDSPLFPTNAVTPVLTDSTGTVDDIGGCQSAPAIDGLGVGEWVLVERLEMSAVGIGGPVTLTLTDANNLFAGTSIIGQLNNVDPADIDFQTRVFSIGDCMIDADCGDSVTCTLDTCVALSCVNTPINGLCDDGLWCNGAETCDAVLDCQAGAVVNCDDAVACTDDSCNDTTDSCDNVSNDANCDDGQWCNGAETCDVLLDCQVGTAPDCDDAVGCTIDTCDEVNDVCVNTTDDTACDDGQWCNGAEICDVLLDCQVGTAPNCDDAVGCTIDTCDEVNDVCVNSTDDTACDDGQWCNGAETCDALLDCQVGTPPDCDDLVSCTVDTCDEVNDVCVNTADDTLCDDGQWCNGAETCDAVLDCQAGIPPDCNDLISCTIDTCDEVGDACINATDDTLCDDLQWCNGAETCDALLDCQAGTAVDCDDGVACTDDSCNEGTDSCDNVANDVNCDDGLWCNGFEICDAVLDCQAGSAPNCDDGVVCTDDSCNETTDSCDNVANDVICDDGQWCNGAETCDTLLDCQAGTAVNCDDGVACTDDSCNEGTDSCDNLPNDSTCDDGLWCNGAEVCDVLLDCQAGVPPTCDDAVGCTVDTCDEVNDVCVFTEDDSLCDDSVYCNGPETCDAVLDCQGASDPCTNPFTPVCDEPNDRCVECLADLDCTDPLAPRCDVPSGVCTECLVNGDCADGVACTVDTCNPATLTCDPPQTDDTRCDDGVYCNGGETCDLGLDCQVGSDPCTDPAFPVCDEVNDTCVECLVDGDCDDAAFCNGSETCLGNVCQAGTDPCDDGIPCTIDSCDEGIDTCSNTPDDTPCDDGLYCNGSEVCDVVLGCRLDVSPCDDGVGCTLDGCDEIADVCTGNTPDNLLCDDGLYCNGNETCDPVLDCQPGSAPCTDPLYPNCIEGSDSCVGGVCGGDGDCDDGVYCNGPEVCLGSLCQPGTPLDCDDGISCTDDFCYEFLQWCAHTALDNLCDDGAYCNGAETCDSALDCQPGTDPCTDPAAPACDETADACVECLIDDDCSDGTYCNGLEVCLGGVCQTGSFPCDDGINCTSDQCDEINGCTNTTNDTFCDDGLYCNGQELCHPTLDCQSGTAPCAPPTSICDELGDVCVECVLSSDCDDGLYCNGAETCVGNVCQLAVNPCNDGVGCTVDSCDEGADTCANVPVDLLCDDGTYCNGSETCDPALDCLLGSNPCTDPFAPICDEPNDSCVECLTAGDCDDGLYCNGGETCVGNVCQAATSPCTDPAFPLCDEPNDSCVECLFTTDCDDGLYCNGAETCQGNVCQAAADPCNDGVGCTVDSCDEGIDVCTNMPLDSLCDDGLYCTGAETCHQLLDCQAGTDPCTDPATPNCDEANDICVTCLSDGDCDDGLYCTGVETCVASACQPGTPPNCDDGVACTVDACNEIFNTCANTPDSGLCDDGQWCNGAETCDPALDCQAGTTVDCGDGVACTDDSCNEGTDSCDNVTNDANCDDGLWCNGFETCDAVLDCQAGTDPCDDGLACTNDPCYEFLQTCLPHEPDHASCSDGVYCNGSEICDLVLDCLPGPDPCDDGLGCTTDSCDEGTDTCANTPQDSLCDDGQWCNGFETCHSLLDCQAGTAMNCDDGVACTDDSCNEGTDSCDSIANHANCDDGVACTNDACHVTLDCQFTPSDANCDDGQWCNGSETCHALLDCQAGTAVDCDDGIACTEDACNEGTDSCDSNPNDANCDDGLLCNGLETCDAALGCLPGADPCDDGVICTVDACDEATGCSWEQAFRYGDLDHSDAINIFDIFCVLNGFAGQFPDCSFEDVDIFPCQPDGVINVFELFAVLDAFSGYDPCCQNGIGACCTTELGCHGVDDPVDCTAAGGTFLGLGTSCFSDSDNDGIPDALETNDLMLNLPCSTGTDPNNPDTDGDGIKDGDEIYGTSAGLDLPSMGANPFRTDIFVEVDWTDDEIDIAMHTHRPSPAAVTAVVNAFADAPVTNLDGTTGIALHVDYGQGGVFTGGNLIPGTWFYITFDAGFNAFKFSNLADNRKGYFHYGIFAHRYDSSDNDSSGIAEINGNDFMVTLQLTSEDDSDVSKTLMHMLGHNLSLRHGGDQDIDYKPNYNSVMNSRFQFDGIDGSDCNSVGDGTLDYSIGTRFVLDEGDLNEFFGVCGNVAINWDGGGLSSSARRNINCVAGTTTACGSGDGGCYDSTCTVLTDYDDWASLIYGGVAGGDAPVEITACRPAPTVP